MSFASKLQRYLQESGATASELAEAADISKSSLSRYLSGKRVPDSQGDAPARLARALAALAEAHGGAHVDAAAIEAALARSADEDREGAGGVDPAAFSLRLANVLDAFGVARNRLARSMGFDPSYISRILAGQRRPADLPRFVDDVAAYIARNYGDAAGIALAAELTGQPADELAEPVAFAQAIRHYLGSDSDDAQFSRDAIESFLEKLDAFNLDDFLRDIHFDEIKLPTVPFQLPTTKTYTGIEQMKQAELDFLRAAVLSKSTDDVILYSDMPLGEMASDEEFPKKVMAGMAMLIRKGVRLRNIHDVHRPLDELFMGLEGWIPAYLTGQISPYYLTQPTNTAFLHFIRSAGTVAASGEAIAGNQAGGRYVVTKNAADVAYYRQRAEELLARARPLMDIYREGDSARLERALHRLQKKAKSAPVEVAAGTFRNMKITVWPNSHALIEKSLAPKVSLLVEYPALVDALERFEPTLF